MEQSNGAVSGGHGDGLSRYIRRVSRTAQPQIGAQDLAFGAQIPGQ